MIAYSGDFPISVDVREHNARLLSAGTKRYQHGTASITGATYFYRFILADDEHYLTFEPNLYSRGVFSRSFSNPFVGEQREEYAHALKNIAGPQKQKPQKQKPENQAATLQQIATEHPTLAPIWIKTAEAYLAAGDRGQATKMLKQAIAAGWKSSTYLREHPQLSSLLRDPSLAGAMRVLDDSPIELQLPMPFSAQQSWTQCGYPVPITGGGAAYFMSCSLAVLHKRGSKLDQAIAVLNRAAAADRTYPDGEFRFADHGDVRSRTRRGGFSAAQELIEHAGYRATIYPEAVPSASGDVSGLMLGSATVALRAEASGSLCRVQFQSR